MEKGETHKVILTTSMCWTPLNDSCIVQVRKNFKILLRATIWNEQGSLYNYCSNTLEEISITALLASGHKHACFFVNYSEIVIKIMGNEAIVTSP